MAGTDDATIKEAFDEFAALLAPNLRARLGQWCWTNPLDFRDPAAVDAGAAWYEKRGIYAFLDRTGTPVYIGKATMQSSLGHRVWDPIGLHGKSRPDPIDGKIPWKGTPRSRAWLDRAVTVRALVFEEDLVFLAAAFEELLIGRLVPPGNRMGTQGGNP